MASWSAWRTSALLVCMLGVEQTMQAQERAAERPSDGHTHPEIEEASEIKPLHESITIVAEPVGPQVQPNLAEILSQTLISRDDQVLQMLGAGINAGQHEGGGKSLEIRRYGFNLDHGGAGGGLRITVDNVAQNYGTQGHGQGYVGSLKSLSPELIEDVTLINGPFRAEHGDFSGLGVVQIRLRESMPDEWTAKLQGGSFGSARAFLAWSPSLEGREALIAYEVSHTDGPFIRPLDYVRHNLTGNYMWELPRERHVGFKFNGGLNSFNSSGQIPTDEVAAGRLDRFGFISPSDGGEVQQGRVGLFFRKDFRYGSGLRADAFVERSLFDLYSNFTFLLADPVLGDAIQQHDSRLSEGADVQYSRPSSISGGSATFTLGGNLLSSQNLVDLRRAPDRNPVALLTSANARVTNTGAYAQENLTLAHGRLQLTGGMRLDAFRFRTMDLVQPAFSQSESTLRFQPKGAVAFSPWQEAGLRLFYNYGRGIASMDARGASRRPEGPHVSTTDFQQAGFQYLVLERWSVWSALFDIRQSNQLVYIPDDGTIEFSDPSRSYGYEVKTAVDLTDKLTLNGSLTKVLNGYFRGDGPRLYLERAPRFVADASLTLAGWRKWSGSLRMRAINHYRLDAEDPTILAAGSTVFDLAVSRRISRNLELYFSADNLFDRAYWETQNYFESRLAGQAPRERIHATPGFGRTLVVGVTFKLGRK